MSSYTLSIIIPMYNVEDYISECLQSLLNQDRHDIEIIVIDDCSSDMSPIIAFEFHNKFTNFKLYKNKYNTGLGRTRNKGIKIAKGNYILFLDSDDWLTKNAIITVINKINHANYDFIHFGCNKINKRKNENNLYTITTNSHQLKLIDRQIKTLNQPNYAWLKVCNREFISTNNLIFNSGLYEDISWNIQMILKAETIGFSEYTIYNYRERQGSILTTESNRHLDFFNEYNLVYKDLSYIKINRNVKITINNTFIKGSYYLFKSRSMRLGERNTDVLLESFSEIIKKYKIYPTSIKTCIMMTILISNRIKYLLFHRRTPS